MNESKDFPNANPSQLAFIFPGQGSQSVGMGRELAEKYPIARQTFEEADEALGYRLSQFCFDGPEEKLRLTEITQPAILTVSIAALRVIESQIPKPCAVAGHSLGEYSAHVASGTMPFAQAVCTVRDRGKYMQEAVPVGVGAMAAIVGLPLEKVEEICREAAQGEVCSPANINSQEQIVISGHTAAVERGVKLASERGARLAKLLPVSAPFHCSLMKPAQDRLGADLNHLKMQKPVYPVICNVSATPVSDELQARETLSAQVTGAVKWEQSMRWLIEDGVQMFLEIGPGKVLCGLMRQIDRSKTCLNIGDVATLTKALAQFGS
ncbi:MAG TPA: ACP S-malonyltransferase [Candidatus Aquilonibacter sp.]|jgi:[acyl-carrier-protein] S-malonyltransferase|nr:ACP S-malonyltransferase [Candidatus Aquilonibacter sp.]